MLLDIKAVSIKSTSVKHHAYYGLFLKMECLKEVWRQTVGLVSSSEKRSWWQRPGRREHSRLLLCLLMARTLHYLCKKKKKNPSALGWVLFETLVMSLLGSLS